MVFPAIGAAYFIINDWEMFKNHLIGCEYMQIDPSRPYSAEFIEDRASHVLSQWNGSDDQDSVESLRRTLDVYVRMVRDGPEVPIVKKMMEIADEQKQMTEPFAFNRKASWGPMAPPEPRRKDTISETLAKKASKLIKDGKMSLQPGTVSETYVKKELRHDNFDNYLKKMPRWPN
ncbi:MAG: hypothetical protein FWD81_06395 [Methanomassiliicoccaceae archaeon]|nr:hypothetical protein [Methanomassiliicoccaceae archaeon]